MGVGLLRLVEGPGAALFESRGTVAFCFTKNKESCGREACIFDVTKSASPRKLQKFAGTGGEQTADLQRVADTITVTSHTGGESIVSSDGTGRSVTILNTTD
jgi:hypothetical protein